MELVEEQYVGYSIKGGEKILRFRKLYDDGTWREVERSEKSLLPQDLLESISAFDTGAKMPSKIQMAKNLMKAGKDCAKALKQGDPIMASAEEAEKRLTVCEGCEEFYDKRTGRCRACGCFMSLKARLAPMVCPVGKW